MITIYGKNLLKCFSPEPEALFDLETWHAAAETEALQSLYKR